MNEKFKNLHLEKDKADTKSTYKAKDFFDNLSSSTLEKSKETPMDR